MAQETITILNIETGQAVKSIGELEKNVRALKASLKDAEVGSEDFKRISDELRLNQNALKDAMHATNASMQDIQQAAGGASESYNGLVHKMAELKSQLRETDVSTVEGAEQFNKLAKQINVVNNRLKEMDAAQGNHQRNVGNYKSALQGVSGVFQQMGGNISGLINPINGATSALKVFSQTPALAMLGVLAGALMKVVEGLKSSEDNMNAVTAAMAPLKAGSVALSRVMQTLGKGVAWVATQFTALLNKLGLVSETGKDLQDITAREIALQKDERRIAMENADLELKIAQLKATASEKDRVSAADRKKALEEAIELERKVADNNVSLARRQYEILRDKSQLADNSKEENDALAQSYVEMRNAERDYFQRLRELNAQRVEAINAINKETAANTKLAESRQEAADGTSGLIDVTKALTESSREAESRRTAAAKAEAQQLNDINALVKADADNTSDYVSDVLAEVDAEMERQAQEMEARMQARVTLIQGVAASVSSVLGSIADMYESNGDESVAAAEKIKNLRIAAATIDTISGAVAAYTGAIESVPGPAGIALGLIQAATVTAAGMAQIAKIKATDVSGRSSSGGVSAVQSAPASSSAPVQVQTLTSASDEVRLNERQSSQRVYILSSDLEANRRSTRARIAETTF